MGRVDIGRVGIWTRDLDQMPSSQAVEFVTEAAELGYGAVWLPEILGRDRRCWTDSPASSEHGWVVGASR